MIEVQSNNRTVSRSDKNLENKNRRKTMSTVTNEKETSPSVARGLQIRKFDGKIAEDKEKKQAEVKYVYERIVLPSSRVGKDIEGKDVEGAFPSLSELLAWANSSGFTTEFKLDKENNPEGPSVVGFLVEGINAYLNRTARIKAENTPESAKEKALQVFMSKTGMSRSAAEEFLATAFAK